MDTDNLVAEVHPFLEYDPPVPVACAEIVDEETVEVIAFKIIVLK